ncbi:MAG TPA: pectate lyase [Tepidisphaeraceae bacterium]|nr:pectate lyase [Tepidisphaeraceae bacterium]
MRRHSGLVLALLLLAPVVRAADAPSGGEARAALLKAVHFYHKQVADRGGYVWRYSADLKLREGEGVAPPGTVWVQPPGTPAVGEAFLDAFEATGEQSCLDAARDAGQALALGQLHSGGWNYRIEFGDKRKEFSYRFDLDWQPLPDPAAGDRSTTGWDAWKRRKYRKNQTVLDDDTTQAATRFLVRLDKALSLADPKAHAAADIGLASLLKSQYPNGAWSANYDRVTDSPPPADLYPVKKADYPPDWPRTWPKDFTGCYVTNDDLMSDCVTTMLLAWEAYGDERYLASAKRAGDFLLLAQMPEPQPAWAQQYDKDMHPVWSRAFEPPAISGGESQGILRTLLALYRATGDEKYLRPVPAAVEYLRRSRLPDGRLARFYELRTNRPIYMVRDADRRYHITYDGTDKRIATHYAFTVGSDLAQIEKGYRRVKESGVHERKREDAKPEMSASLAAKARSVIDSLEERGAWVEQGRLRGFDEAPAGGVIDSETFCENVGVLSRFLRATAKN